MVTLLRISGPIGSLWPSGSEAGSYLRLLDCVYHSTLGLRVIKKKRRPVKWHIAPGNVDDEDDSGLERHVDVLRLFRGGLAFQAHRLLYHSA